MTDLAATYRLSRALSWTASARTFAGELPETGEKVAVKIIALGDHVHREALARRFKATAAVLKGLSHPSLPVVLDFGVTEKDEAYLVTAWFPGAPMDELDLSPGAILNVALQVAEALEAIALHGLAHLSVGPQNVLIMPDHSARLTGWGSSLLEVEWQSGVGPSFGTTNDYSAPELGIRRSAGEALWRADLYSLASMTVRQLGAQIVDEGGDVQVRFPGELSRQLNRPEVLRAALQDCLRPDPESRPASYSALTRPLQQAMPRDSRPDLTSTQPMPRMSRPVAPASGTPSDEGAAASPASSSGVHAIRQPAGSVVLPRSSSVQEAPGDSGGEELFEAEELGRLIDEEIEESLLSRAPEPPAPPGSSEVSPPPDVQRADAAKAGEDRDITAEIPVPVRTRPPSSSARPAAVQASPVEVARPTPEPVESPRGGAANRSRDEEGDTKEIPVVSPPAAAEPPAGPATLPAQVAHDPRSASAAAPPTAPSPPPGAPQPVDRAAEPSPEAREVPPPPVTPRSVGGDGDAAPPPAQDGPGQGGRGEAEASAVTPAEQLPPLPPDEPAEVADEPVATAPVPVRGSEEQDREAGVPTFVVPDATPGSDDGRARPGASTRGDADPGRSSMLSPEPEPEPEPEPAPAAAAAGTSAPEPGARGTRTPTPGGPGTGRRRWSPLQIGLAAALLLAVVLAGTLVALLRRDEPPRREPVAPAPEVREADLQQVADLMEEPEMPAGLMDALRLASEGQWLAARDALDAFEQGTAVEELPPGHLEALRSVRETIELGYGNDLGARLDEALEARDVEQMRSVLAGGDFAISTIGRRPGGEAALEEARSMVTLMDDFRAALATGTPVEALEAAAAIESGFPELAASTEVVNRSLENVEAVAAGMVERRRLEEARSLLATVAERRDLTPRLASLRDQVQRTLERRVRLEDALERAESLGRDGAPHEGLELLSSLDDVGSLDPGRVAEVRRSLQLRLAELDGEAPTLALASEEIDLRRDQPLVIDLLASDDYEVMDVVFRASLDGQPAQTMPVTTQGPGRYRIEIPAEVHAGKVVRFWAQAVDRSGQLGELGTEEEPLELRRRRWFRIFQGRDDGSDGP